MKTAPATEGRIRIDDAGHEVYFERYGAADATLLVLHGGPGVSSEYLERLSELASDKLQVVFYDQLGGGRSDRPDDPSLWTIPRFVAEVEALREGLDLGRVHLYGQSWGGFLALEYALAHPGSVRTLVLSNTGASGAQVVHEMMRLRMAFGPKFLTKMLKCEAEGDLTSPEYEEAVLRLYATHLRRSTPFEPERSLVEFRELVLPLLSDVGPAYYGMWGPNEFVCTGPELDFDVTERLHEIQAPTLILCGYFDELTVACHRTLADGIPDNEFAIFGNSSHCTILEKEADLYLDVIRSFLRRRGLVRREH